MAGQLGYLVDLLISWRVWSISCWTPSDQDSIAGLPRRDAAPANTGLFLDRVRLHVCSALRNVSYVVRNVYYAASHVCPPPLPICGSQTGSGGGSPYAPRFCTFAPWRGTFATRSRTFARRGCPFAAHKRAAAAGAHLPATNGQPPPEPICPPQTGSGGGSPFARVPWRVCFQTNTVRQRRHNVGERVL